ncbi:hypothetical protein PO883_07870 [Massilia sp. DJPM01]|uniref:hypothetical protein n=1 Tax=Massilia sp. DJPM01 TaxID=3024404 RepID=UPI00259DEAB9|nr:hypothetical protein [Massilia sp. DJPM01]MDM5177111.1 hypothetical protein [Massilia sp. DJPM01]
MLITPLLSTMAMRAFCEMLLLARALSLMSSGRPWKAVMLMLAGENCSHPFDAGGVPASPPTGGVPPLFDTGGVVPPLPPLPPPPQALSRRRADASFSLLLYSW